MLSFFLFVSPAAPAAEDRPTFKSLLQAQANFLARLDPEDKAESCSARYERIWRDGQLEIDWFYGYLNARSGAVVDRIVREEMVRALSRRCGGGLAGACGFRVEKDLSASAGPIQLRKKTSAGSVRVRIWYSTVSDENRENTILGFAREEQREKTKIIWKAYLKSLRDTEIVFYDGHSRGGSGPGFGPYGLPQMVGGALLRTNWNKVVRALEQAPRAPELVAFASCESQNYYLPSLKRVSPSTAVAAIESSQTFGTNEQMLFSLVDSLVVGRCEKGINRAFTAHHGKFDGRMRIKGFD